MDSDPRTKRRSVLRVVGSLWFAAVLLVLLLVSMACATVYESTHGTEQALAMFYKTWWFGSLLALLAVNVAAAMVVRYPFSRWQVGFVLTHAGILVTLGGALITKHFGVDGQVGFFEGETVDRFSVPKPTLTLRNRLTQSQLSVDLNASRFSGFRVLNDVRSPVLSLDDVRVELRRYLPDSEISERIADDNPHPQPAVEISLSPSGLENAAWVFAGQTVKMGSLTAAYRIIDDGDEFARLIEGKEDAAAESGGMVNVTYKGSSFPIPLEDASGREVPLGDTGCTIRVLRYLPRATVGPDDVVNDPNRPLNPAVEVEFTGPDGKEKRWAFARFPDVRSMHGRGGAEDLRVTFIAPPTASVEVVGGPNGGLYVRFLAEGHDVVTHELTVGAAIESPWPGRKFAVVTRLDHARLVREMVPVDPVRKKRVCAVLLTLSTSGRTERMWLQKYRPRSLTVDDTPYELSFSDKEIPLKFGVKLDRFQIGYYPGERRPRSFTSHITIVDPASGGTQSRVVSMNNPTKYGGYTFYQSSYRLDKDRAASFLSVARDPGLPVVFAGYIAVMTGMVLVLIRRVTDFRRAVRQTSQEEGSRG